MAMKFDLFDAMEMVAKDFGDDGEIVISRDTRGYKVRIRVYYGGDSLAINQFIIGHNAMELDNRGTAVMFNRAFKKCIIELKQEIADHG